MVTLERTLVWCIFQAAICHARAIKKGADWGAIWAVQRQMGYPPTGLIRSCE